MSMSSQEHSSPARHRLPLEIVAEIGQWLDGKTLLAALQVSKTWYKVHYPILWNSLTEPQWSHPRFPFHERLGQGGLSKYESFFPLSISRQEEAARIFTLRSILKQLRNLRSVALGIDWKYGPAIIYVSDLLHCPHLKSLKISATDFSYKKDTGDILLLVSRLEELYLTQSSADIFFKGCDESNLPPLAVWEMRKLRIAHEDMVMLRYCPKLRELEIKLQARLFQLPPRPQAMKACPELEVLRITAENQYDGPVFCDLAETFKSLKRLKVLLLPIRNVDQLESLCLPEDSQEVSSSGTLPILEHLELSDVQLDLGVTKSDNLHQLLVKILRTRPLLKTFVFRGHEVKPWQLFAQSSLECHKEWQCMALETLDLHFTWRLYTRPREERCELWRSVFRQIGKLPKLKSLTILCDGLEKSIDAGILELGGARSLECLDLCDRQAPLRTKDEVVTLMQVVPGLVSLSLAPTSNPKQIASWIKETGRDILH
ncbi:hypothetical protein BGZ67_000219 [Mortierella alpina]|nr:hypothetical protein BGZ67_000219 [Mortierella alpina]